MKTALTIFVLLAILAGAVWVGHYGWESAGDVVMPAWGWLMMGLGIFFTLLVGGGLMALVFYSSRAGELNGGGRAQVSLPQRHRQGAAHDVVTDIDVPLAGSRRRISEQGPAPGAGGAPHGGDDAGGDRVPARLGGGAQKVPCVGQQVTGLIHLHVFSLSRSVRVARK